MAEQEIFARRFLADAGTPVVLRDVAIRFDASGVTRILAGQAPPPEVDDLLVLPPLCNAHDHGRGLRPIAYGAGDHAVEAWVPATYTLPGLDPYLVAAAAFARMAAGGIGSIVHCHLSRAPERLIAEAAAVSRAARDVGVRVAFVVPLRDRHRLAYGPDEAVLAYLAPEDAAGVAERWLKPIPPIEAQLEAVAEIAATCENDFFQVQYGPVGVEWCSDRLLRRVAEDSAASGRRVHMHLLESKYQRAWADRNFPGGLLDHLGASGLLTPRLTVAHATWLRSAECQALARHGVTVSVNTSSNLRLRSGIAPLPEMHAAGTGFALGLDALALDDDDDLLRELRLTYLLHRGTGFDERLTRAEMLAAVTRTGAGIASSCPGIGRIAVGGPADLLAIDFAALSADLGDGLSDEMEIVQARACRRHVHALYVGGRPIVAGHRVLGIDADAIERALAAELAKAGPELRVLRPLLQRYQAALQRFYQDGGHLTTAS